MNLKHERAGDEAGAAPPENASATVPGNDASSSLDTALLESLFYNEMMMMESSHHGFDNLLDDAPASAPQTASASVASVDSDPRTAHHPEPSDSKDVAEKALLRDFGVSESPVPARHRPNAHPTMYHSGAVATAATIAANALVPPSRPNASTHAAVASAASEPSAPPAHGAPPRWVTPQAAVPPPISLAPASVPYSAPLQSSVTPEGQSYQQQQHQHQQQHHQQALVSVARSVQHIPIQPRPTVPFQNATASVTDPSSAAAAVPMIAPTRSLPPRSVSAPPVMPPSQPYPSPETAPSPQPPASIPRSASTATVTAQATDVSRTLRHSPSLPSMPSPSLVPQHTMQQTTQQPQSQPQYYQTAPANTAPQPPISQSSTQTTATSVPTAPAPAPVAPNNQKAEQLVKQFATLASKLGIELPEQTLQSLTAAATLKEQNPNVTVPLSIPSPVQPSGSTETPSSVHQGQGTAAPQVDSTGNPKQDMGAAVAAAASVVAPASTTSPVIATSNPGTTILSTAPTAPKIASQVEEVRRTAEAAIEAVSRKRELPPSFETERSQGSGTVGGNSSSNKAVYSKRRKKPTLSDCETKLAELKAENELLKRHLQHMSNKAIKFDQEKNAASKRIKSYLESGASTTEMQRGVQDFTDMYSDYGRRRQRELNFHLEQLQRLVNPTNFTKMGLWTLAQSSSNPKQNPIAGILQRELQITPQQGKKIMVQRERIRSVCDNLKESLQLLAELRGLCAQKTRLFHDRMKKCQEILTPKQVVKLIRWIDDNAEVLDSVCPGWGAEHIHTPLKR